tara:strand:+ start:1058 stop:1903 length:846 start_codon:yes stop_codon:yes gene_type:complete
MNITEVKNLTPKERFAYWVSERSEITTKKDSGESGPWTDDDILQSYHFTNVRREDDKVSRWLVENLYDEYTPSAWATILVARFVNNPITLEMIASDLKSGDLQSAKAKLVEFGKGKEPTFRSAYLQPEIKGVNRLDKIFDILAPKMLEATITTDTLEGAINDICKIKYMGEFMSGQIVMDAMLFVPGKWSDTNTYAPEGPGSLRGISRLKEVKLELKVKRPEYNEWLHNLSESLNIRALDVEHALCEWDKYERLLWSQGNYNRAYKNTEAKGNAHIQTSLF